MRKIYNGIIFICFFFCLLVFNTCKESNPTEINNNSQYTVNTWINVTNGLPISWYRITSVGNKIYVATGNKLFSSSDNGASWESSFDGLPDSILITAVAGYENYIALGTENDGVFVSTNFGKTWLKPQNYGLGSEHIRSIEIDSEYIFVGAGNDAEIYRSSDLGNIWSAFDNGFPQTTPIFYPRIGILKKENGILFACPSFSGIYFSEDNGMNWHSMNNGLPDDCGIMSFAMSDSFYFVTEASYNEGGLYRCDIDDLRWTKVSGLTNYNFHFVTARGGTVLAAVDSVIKISFDNGNNWQLCNKGLEDRTREQFYYAVFHNGYIFTPESYGGIWRYQL